MIELVSVAAPEPCQLEERRSSGSRTGKIATAGAERAAAKDARATTAVEIGVAADERTAVEVGRGAGHATARSRRAEIASIGARGWAAVAVHAA